MNLRRSGSLSLLNDDEVNIKKFFQFLEGHVLSKEANEDQNSSLQKHRRRSGRRPGDEEDMSAASLMGASENKKLKCGFCGKNHETTKCPAALSKTPEERWDMLMKRKGAPTCFNCLQPGSISHNLKTCRAPKCSVVWQKSVIIFYIMQTTQTRMKKRPSRCLVLFLRKSKVYFPQPVVEWCMRAKNVLFVFCWTVDLKRHSLGQPLLMI